MDNLINYLIKSFISFFVIILMLIMFILIIPFYYFIILLDKEKMEDLFDVSRYFFENDEGKKLRKFKECPLKHNKLDYIDKNLI